MTNPFANLAVTETETDYIPSSGPLESGIYEGIITMAYRGISKAGAAFMALTIDSNGRSHSEKVYVTSGNAKGNKATYTDKKSGKEKPLPGYLLGSAFANLAGDKTIQNLATEEKIVNIYDYEQKKELPTKVDVFIDLLDSPIIVGLVKTIEDERKANDSGSYEATGETREQTQINKVFRASDRKTVAEAMVKDSAATYIDNWEKRYTGTLKDNSKGTSGVAGAPKTNVVDAAGSAAKPSQSLWG